LSYTSRYDNGDWIADCDVCGRKYKASALTERWDGLMCCNDDWEIRQPQDFVRGVPDTQIAPWLRPEPANSFIPITLSQGMTTSGPSVSTTTLLTVFTAAPYNFYITSPVTATLSFARVLPATATALNGSAININTLG
jgi:hypothetical protein